MILPVFFSHGYREREAIFNRYFARLLTQFDFHPGIDPPSNDVNSAKLEKELGYSSGLVAVLTNRSGAISQYIRYEINLSMRVRKPTLVFVEDTIPGKLIPPGIIQKRFSGRSYIRQINEHMHALKVFKTYIGKRRNPRYNSLTRQRTVLLIGMKKLGIGYIEGVNSILTTRGYEIVELNSHNTANAFLGEDHFEISSSYLAICNVDDLSGMDGYLLGAVQSIQVPCILLTQEQNVLFEDWVPGDFQPRVISKTDLESGLKIIADQVELYEQDFVELAAPKMVDEYVNALIGAPDDPEKYTENTRTQIINNITMGDKFENISNSTVVNKSIVENAFNTIKSNHGEEMEKAFRELHEKVLESKNPAAENLMNGLTEEAQKKNPEKSKIKAFWDGLVSMLPGIGSMVGIASNIVKLFV